MSEIKLFEVGTVVKERTSSTVVLEKQLQTTIEQNMETFFGVRFLKSEYMITSGRMDSIGIDENNSPVIFEYKRSSSENVINQGLFYLDWLLDHKADFKLLVIEKLGMEVADQIDWSVPCVICIANDFTKYDVHAVNQLEKQLQTTIEQNMETFFGVRFLKSEYMITSGRMDSIGIDENNSPVIFEYKRSSSENVINQGLFYLDWLLDHKADFKLLVIEKLGMEVADQIDWSVPCVICIANDFTKYDVHAVNQMQRNIKLVKYRKYGEDLLLFEHLNTPVAKPVTETSTISTSSTYTQKTHLEKLASASSHFKTLYTALCDYIESLGDDLVPNQLKLYLAYKKVQNIFCIEIYNKQILLRMKLDPDTVELEEGFTRDTRGIGHYGTGELEVSIKTAEDFQKAKKLIDRAYQETL